MLSKIKSLAQSALSSLAAMPKLALGAGIAIGYIGHPIIKLGLDAARLLLKI